MFMTLALAAVADIRLTPDCPVCRLCPAPYGVCVFLWASAALVLLLVLTLLLGKKYRCPVCNNRVKRKTRVCANCGYDFETGQLPAYARHLAPDFEQQSAATLSQPASPARSEAPAPAPAFVGRKACPYCGKDLPANALFCGGCGSKL